MEYLTLDRSSIEEILVAHNDAFSNYEVPMELSLERFKQINKQRGVRYDLSIGAYEEGKLVGFILNGIGEWNGKLTAYDCGTGVIQGRQGKGIGGELFTHLTPILIANHIEHYLLEVLKTNEPAYKLYRGKGFKVVREFDCVVVTIDKLNLDIPKRPEMDDLVFTEIEEPDWNQLQAFWEITPSWQNSIDSIGHIPENYKIITVSLKNKIIGYGVIEHQSGGITQLAIHPHYRRQKIGSFLLQHLMETTPNLPRLHITNIDLKAEAFKKFVDALGFESFCEQYEMMLELN